MSLAMELHQATIREDTELVRSILSENQDNLDFVNLRTIGNDMLSTPLVFASMFGLIELVKLLVRMGKANPDIKDSGGYTATFRAVERGDLDVLKILVEEGGSNTVLPNGPDSRTALMEAIYRPEELDIVLYLIRHVENINVKNSEGYSALFIATEGGNLEIIRNLLSVGKADPDLKNGNGGWTAAMRASNLGLLNVLRVLIQEGGANPEIKSNRFGKNVLHFAAHNGRTSIVDYLVTQVQLDASQKDVNGLTPLYLASKVGSLGVVRYLVGTGKVDVNSKNGPGFNSISLGVAAEKGHSSIVKYLLKNGAKSHVDFLNLNHISPLYFAAEEGHTDAVKILVQLGKANVEVKNTDKLWTALHIATERGHLDIVQFLVITAGANSFAVTGDGRDTPLSLALKNGHERIAQYLKSIFTQLAGLAEQMGVSQVATFLRTVLRNPSYSLEEFVANNSSSLQFLQDQFRKSRNGN